jgi:hypothetical protein
MPREAVVDHDNAQVGALFPGTNTTMQGGDKTI